MKIDSFTGEYAFLSNFYYLKDPIRCDMGVFYPTVEHAFQAQKYLYLVDRVEIAKCKTPGMSKRLGRRVTLRSDWNNARIDVMYSCLQQKFADHDLHTKLLATGDAELVEGNTWGDTYWGVDVKRGGLNMLGKLLMKLRGELREQHRVGATCNCR